MSAESTGSDDSSGSDTDSPFVRPKGHDSYSQNVFFKFRRQRQLARGQADHLAEVVCVCVCV